MNHYKGTFFPSFQKSNEIICESSCDTDSTGDQTLLGWTMKRMCTVALLFDGCRSRGLDYCVRFSDLLCFAAGANLLSRVFS